jgi:hypothetical protein
MRCFLSIGFILVVLHILVPHASAQPLFEVERESFCKGVQDREPMNSFLNVAEIRKGEDVFLWMEIKGGERALTMLEAKGQMSIYHAWASEKGVTDIIDIGITKQRWLELANAMRNQFREQGFFTWRTYSAKRNFKEGRWYVSILDANKKPVRKVGPGTEALRPELVIRFVSK